MKSKGITPNPPRDAPPPPEEFDHPVDEKAPPSFEEVTAH
jgi:hypothetical protein